MKIIFTFLSLLLLFTSTLFSQGVTDTSGKFKSISAGPEYKRSSFYQWLWGTNYRKEWATPLRFPASNLDTLRGGIKEFKVGGGHQSKSLHLKTTDGKEYALRSVDKSLSFFFPEVLKHTFIEHLANDQISMSHPYGALVVPLMAQAAGIAHTYPQILWIPKQPSLDTLNKFYGDRLYLFEQRPAGDWSDADNLKNFKKFISSDDMMEKLTGEHDISVDQVSYVRARLFDMVIGDWDRHYDQWKWSAIEKDDQKIFEAIPTDRDQAFSKHNGVLLNLAISGQKYLQSFDYTIKDPTAIEKRFLDRILMNEVILEQWQSQAKSIQDALTDNVIETSVKQLPPEIFAISGNEIIAKLKSRRDHLLEYATLYYYHLAKEVDILGTKKRDYFEIDHISNDETAVNIYKLNKEGKKHITPYYMRTFKTAETKEIRFYGLSGEDIYHITGKSNSPIRIRIIGGDERDSVIDNSNGKVVVYDDHDNTVVKGAHTKLHLSETREHTWFYTKENLEKDLDSIYIPDRRGIKPLVFYDNNDRLFVGLGYGGVHHKWGKFPFASKYDLEFRYSLSQKDIDVLYKILFPNLIGKWDLSLYADYDAVRWTNFYGLGNNSIFTTSQIDYNRMRTKEISGNVGLERTFTKNTIGFSGFFQSVQILNDTGRYITKVFAPVNPGVFNTNSYAGIQLNYKLVLLNDSIVPTKGFAFFGEASFTQNLQNSQSFGKYSGIAQVYIPLFSKFSLGIRGGGATVSGNPMFYQMPHLGGADDMRGYRRERFWGRSAVFNSNELRFITNIRSYIMKGKFGIVLFYDEGRVWMPSEVSDVWHTDYGAGLLLAPFNSLLANIAIGISKEKTMLQLRMIKSF